MITCVSGITIRMAVSKISELGRATQGVKLIKVDDGDSIAAITQLDEQEEDSDLVEAAVVLDENGNVVENTTGETTPDADGAETTSDATDEVNDATEDDAAEDATEPGEEV